MSNVDATSHEVLSCLVVPRPLPRPTLCCVVPGAPPQMISAYPESSTSLRLVWKPPPENKQNGIISYYKIFYVAKTRSDSEATVIEIKNPSAREFVIDELMKWADYRIWMLAGTSVGDGPKSSPLDVKTDEDGTYKYFLFKQTSSRLKFYPTKLPSLPFHTFS